MTNYHDNHGDNAHDHHDYCGDDDELSLSINLFLGGPKYDLRSIFRAPARCSKIPRVLFRFMPVSHFRKVCILTIIFLRNIKRESFLSELSVC